MSKQEYLNRLVKDLKVEDGPKFKQVPLNQVVPNPDQPRRYFSQSAHEALVLSIQQDGLMQPIKVVPREEEGGYMIVYGERRYRACLELGWEKIPAIVEKLSPDEVYNAAVLENVQREDLNPIEEVTIKADAVSRALGVPVDEVQKRLWAYHRIATGKTKKATDEEQQDAQLKIEQVQQVLKRLGGESLSSFITHKLPVLKFPEDLKLAVLERNLDYTKASELLAVPVEERATWIQRVLDENLTVQQIREQVQAKYREKPQASPLMEVKKYLTPNRYNQLSTEDRNTVDRLLQELKGVLGK